MHAISKQQAALIRRLIGTGRYCNKSEVVRAGLRLLEDAEREALKPKESKNPVAEKDARLAVERDKAAGRKSKDLAPVK